MDKKGLTITFIVKGLSLNYDEGYGNVSILKKVHRGGGDVYVYASRQSLRYSIVKYASEHLGWQLAELKSAEGVVQINTDKLSQNNYPEEADLFGYMATAGAGKAATARPAVARLTHLVSLEPSFGDIELLNNKWFADRAKKDLAKADPNLANIEQCLAFYKFTLAVDLDRVGEDEINNGIRLAPEKKLKRVQDLLECMKHLYRDIRARREDLKPLFAIGGLYHIKSPLFHNATEIQWTSGKPVINKEAIEQILNSEYSYLSGKENKVDKVEDHTKLGLRKGIFTNEDDIRSLFNNNQDLSPEAMLDSLKDELKEIYGLKN